MKNSKENTLLKNWNLYTNPLRNLTRPQIDMMIDASKRGNDTRLQIAFEQMEKIMPIFSMVLNRRRAGVMNRKWEIRAVDDSEEALKQEAEIQKMFLESDMLNEDGLTAALRHLCLATFRGRAIVKPFIVDNKLIFKKIQNWNALYFNNKLYWNPEIDLMINPLDNLDKLTEIPKDEVCYCIEDIPVDFPGIQIYLRQLVGETEWARFVESCGIPQVILTPPEGTADAQLQAWTDRAIKIFEGGSGTLPAGTTVQQLTGGRGDDTFETFVKHQQEVIVMMATGGTLGSIASGAGMGSGLAEMQDDVFQSLVNYDCKRIKNALNVAVAKCAEALGYANCKCTFEFIESDNISPTEYLDMAIKCKQLGMEIDVEEFKRITGLSFVKMIEQTPTNVWTPSEE
jgi:phage gp29-like protein